MKYLLLSLSLICVQFIYAQCGSNNSSSSSERYDLDNSYTDNSSNEDDSNEDDSNSSFESKSIEDYPNFTIGGGYHTGLASGSFGKVKQFDDYDKQIGTSEQWNQNLNTGYLEIMFPFGADRLISFGFGATWNKMLSSTSDYISNPTPEAYAQVEEDRELHTLYWSTHSKFSSQTLMLQSDIEIFNIADLIYIFGRGEIGFTNYALETKVKYTDNCDCNHSFLLDNSSKRSMTGGLGIGISLGLEWFEIRSTIGYRIYNSTGLRSQNDILNSTSGIDEENYNYNGYPEKEIFSLNRPETTELISRRNGVFYFQIGVNIRFGDRWY